MVLGGVTKDFKTLLIFLFLFLSFEFFAQDKGIIGTWQFNSLDNTKQDFKIIFNSDGDAVMFGTYTNKAGRLVYTGVLLGNYRVEDGELEIDILDYKSFVGTFYIRYNIENCNMHFERFTPRGPDSSKLNEIFQLEGAKFNLLQDDKDCIASSLSDINPYDGNWAYKDTLFEMKLSFKKESKTFDLFMKDNQSEFNFDFKDVPYKINEKSGDLESGIINSGGNFRYTLVFNFNLRKSDRSTLVLNKISMVAIKGFSDSLKGFFSKINNLTLNKY